MLTALVLSLVLEQHYECITDESIPTPTCESTKQRVVELETKWVEHAAKQTACRQHKGEEVARCLAALPQSGDALAKQLATAREIQQRLCASK